MKLKDIGILLIVAALIGGPLQRQLRHHQDRQDLAICERNVQQLATALENYSSFEGLQSPTSLSKLVPKYLDTIPRCPATNADSYSVGYQPNNRQGDWTPWAFTICCHGPHHTRLGLPENYPIEHHQAELMWR